MPRTFITAAVLAAATLVAAPAASASLAAPAITDPAGDAPNRFGTDQAAVDILSSDITTDGTSLVFRTTFAGTPTIGRAITYTASARANAASGESGALLLSVVTEDGRASLSDGNIDPVGAGGPQYGVAGRAAISGRTLTTTYPLAELNRQLRELGRPEITTGTPLARPFAGAENATRNLLGQPTVRAAQDLSSGGDFLLGPA